METSLRNGTQLHHEAIPIHHRRLNHPELKIPLNSYNLILGMRTRQRAQLLLPVQLSQYLTNYITQLLLLRWTIKLQQVNNTPLLSQL